MIHGDKRMVGLLLSGKPILIKSLNIAITPPTIADIMMFGEDEFLFTTQLLVHTDEFVQEIKKGNSELEIYSNFQLLMTLVREDQTVNHSVVSYFNFIFPDYIISFQENMIDFIIEQDGKELVVSRITPFNYDLIKDMIDNLFVSQTVKEEELTYNPANEVAKKIADQINAGRKKIQELKTADSKDQSMFAQIISSLAIGMQMDINIFYNYTPFQLYDTYHRFFLKQSYDLYQKISITPLMDNSKMEVPDEWTKYIY